MEYNDTQIPFIRLTIEQLDWFWLSLVRIQVICPCLHLCSRSTYCVNKNLLILVS